MLLNKTAKSCGRPTVRDFLCQDDDPRYATCRDAQSRFIVHAADDKTRREEPCRYLASAICAFRKPLNRRPATACLTMHHLKTHQTPRRLPTN